MILFLKIFIPSLIGTIVFVALLTTIIYKCSNVSKEKPFKANNEDMEVRVGLLSDDGIKYVIL